MKKVWVVWFEIPYEGGCTPAFVVETEEEAIELCACVSTPGDYGRWRYEELELGKKIII